MVRFAWRFLVGAQVILGATQQAWATVKVEGVWGGVNKENGTIPARKEISKLQESGAEFDLFMQAFRQWEDAPHDDVLSYYQVAGIHGFPNIEWDGVKGGARDSGYCTHGSTLFPVWHRPYMSLVESIITRNAKKIASKYPKSERSEYEKAAETLRFPYWDWASSPEIPDCAIKPEIEVNTPNGRKKIANPLHSYRIDPSKEKGFPTGILLADAPVSVRFPDDNGKTQLDVAQKTLRSSGSTFRINTYELLTGESNYTVFSTDALSDRGESYNSLESLHNTVHYATGGQGHLGYVPWSAWDPIFFLHHSSIDRVAALWQALHPESYVQPVPNGHGNYVRKPGTMEDINTPLAPFHKDEDTYWTAKSARFIKDFGYTYPEIDFSLEPEELSRQVRHEVNKLYNAHGGGSKPSRKRHGHGHGHQHHHRAAEKMGLGDVVEDATENLGDLIEDIGEGLGDKLNEIQDFATMSLKQFKTLGINNMKKQWVVNVKADKTACEEPFNIHFFLGKPPKDQSLWATATNLIGTFAPNAHSDYITFSQIPLSHVLGPLLSTTVIGSIAEDVVVPLLSKLLEWRVCKLDGTLIDTQKFLDKAKESGKDALEVKIATRDVEPLPDCDDDDDEALFEFPSLGEWSVTEDATKDKIGGYCGSQ